VVVVGWGFVVVGLGLVVVVFGGVVPGGVVLGAVVVGGVVVGDVEVTAGLVGEADVGPVVRDADTGAEGVCVGSGSCADPHAPTSRVSVTSPAISDLLARRPCRSAPIANSPPLHPLHA